MRFPYFDCCPKYKHLSFNGFWHYASEWNFPFISICLYHDSFFRVTYLCSTYTDVVCSNWLKRNAIREKSSWAILQKLSGETLKNRRRGGGGELGAMLECRPPKISFSCHATHFHILAEVFPRFISYKIGTSFRWCGKNEGCLGYWS